MVTVTALNRVRCSLRPERIASVVAGTPTIVQLTNGLSLVVRESADEVRRQLVPAADDGRLVAGGRRRHGRAR
jgi:uncharacterized protein YlzI (FlbEa/FlbD family)